MRRRSEKMLHIQRVTRNRGGEAVAVILSVMVMAGSRKRRRKKKKGVLTEGER